MDHQASDVPYPPLHPGGDLGWRVRTQRCALGMTQEELANRAGMAGDYVAFIEERAAEPDASAIIALARALGISREELRGATPPDPAGERREAELHRAP